ncbi:acyl-CoA-binding protein homolog [Fopius arisanus]|uniref:Acyl-CoA-binding protein homolog n=1 Tax=Fopius arisanus TaxID=64838 RepID=A0A9R1T7E2_9HYME|nr:PREDICTED: acyl-CoA-binding protein homolog [Fopius arisanus]
MSLDQDFLKAAESVRNLAKRLLEVDALEFYALYKQATFGDINIERSSAKDHPAKAKWDQWNKKKGMSKDDAKKAYISFVNSTLPKYK